MTTDYTTKQVVDCSTGQTQEMVLTSDEIAALQASEAAWLAAQPNVIIKKQIAALEVQQTPRMMRNAVAASTNVYPVGSPFAGLTDAQALASIETQITALRAQLT